MASPRSNEVSPKPVIFIGSSSEAEDIVDALTELLGQKGEFRIHPWRAGIDLTDDTLSTLIKELDAADFGVFVFHPDDEVVLRGKTFTAARDNVVLEYGMFLGRLGRDRAIALVPSTASHHTPSDLAGINFTFYEDSPGWNFDENAEGLNPAVAAISRRVRLRSSVAGSEREAATLPARGVATSTGSTSPIEDGWQYMLRQGMLTGVSGDDAIQLGTTVVHPLLGAGRVVGYDPPGASKSITVEFGTGELGVYALSAGVILVPRMRPV